MGWTSADTFMKGSSVKRPESLVDVLDQQVARNPDHRAMVIDGDSMTYRELDELSDRVVDVLRHLDVGVGDRVAIWLPNRPEWIAILLGCAKLGALAVPVNTWYKERELRFVLAKSEAKVVFTQQRFLGQNFAEMIGVATADPSIGHPHVISIDGEIPGASLLRDLIPAVPAGDGERIRIEPDAPFLMSFTSGTTSFPKGALLTQRGIASNSVAFAERFEVGEGTSLYCTVPFFHVAGLAFTTLCAFVHGGTLVASGRFTGPAAWEAIYEHGCTHTGGFEAIFHALMDAQPADAALSPLTAAWWGGGPPAFFDRVETGLGLKLMNLYGLTEASGNVTSTPLNWTAKERAASQGIGLDGAEVTIVDGGGLSVGAGVIGEICVVSRGLMLGYFGDPEATARALPPDGSLRTGDLGYLDEAGNLHFVGRTKDMIKVGGENVSASEVEAALSEFPGVVEVAVVGVPHAKYGEVPVAYLRAKGALDPTEILSRLRESIASFKVPDRLVVVADFPRSSTGKIVKAQLRDLATADIPT